MMLAKHYQTDASGEEAKRKAFEALGEVLYINPFDPGVHNQLARLSVELGEHGVTVREYGYLLTLPDTNPLIAHAALATAHAELAKAEGGEEHRASAKEHAQKVLAIDEDHEAAKAILEALGDSE